ncbi:MAG: DNA glycosylase AlkZ-like family protein, partial [Candidatus Bathyarchaeia archaeon]
RKSRIFLPRGDVAATMMADGRMVGVWTLRRMKRRWRLELSPFGRLSEESIEGAESEVDRMRQFTGFEIELDLKAAD